VRRVGEPFVPAALIAVALVALTAVPVAARDTYFVAGPPEIRIVGANGQARDFQPASAEDRHAAAALFQQIRLGLVGGVQPIAETPVGLPHYEIGVGQLGIGDVASIWARLPETTVTYYVGGNGRDFFVVDEQRANRPSAALIVEASPEVSSLIQRHLDDLAPIGIAKTVPGPPAAGWEIAVGAVVLAGFSAIAWEDRRRWRQQGRRSAGSKGT
jgi:hypothetical protein